MKLLPRENAAEGAGSRDPALRSQKGENKHINRNILESSLEEAVLLRKGEERQEQKPCNLTWGVLSPAVPGGTR